MSRTTMVVITGLMLLAGIAALLPAQESSRRTASKFKPPGPAAATAVGSKPGPATTENLAPIVTPATRRRPNAGATSAANDTPGVSQPSLSPTADQSPALKSLAPSSTTPNESVSDQQAENLLSVPRSTYSALTAPPPTTVPANPLDNASETVSTTDSTTDTAAEDSSLHSVLKRSRGSIIYDSTPPATAPPAIAPPPTAPAAAPPTSPAAGFDAAAAMRRSLPPTTGSSPRVPASTLNAVPRSIQDMAVRSKSPSLKAEVVGPQGVTAGKPANYTVTLVNDGDTVAEEVQARIVLPAGIKVVSSQPTSGEMSSQPDAAGNLRLGWVINRVAPRGQEQLKLQLIARQSDSFDLSVEWTARCPVVRASIAVKQPQLQLSLAGPTEMTFGEEKLFTLAVTNPGTGDAEKVTITIGAGGSPPQVFDAGTIIAGHKKELPLAVVASQAGPLELQISAAADGGLEARTSSKVLVRKAEVSLALTGPAQKYAGTEAVYRLAVNNRGTATADNVDLSLQLPPGAKYLGGIEGATPSGGGLKWKIANLAAGGERLYEVRLQLSSPGINHIAVQSQATASGAASSTADTEVEAVADLKLVVNDPAGPVAVGEPATYELSVMNRGTQAARDIKIMMQFAEGIEPISFEGCDARIVPGQLLCQPLPQLAAGQQVTLRVKAQGQQAGSHQFRVEVTSTDGDTRLISEGTTRFFADSGQPGAGEATAKKPSLLPPPSAPSILR